MILKLHVFHVRDSARLSPTGRERRFWILCDDAGERVVYATARSRAEAVQAWSDKHGSPDAIVWHSGWHRPSEAAATIAELAELQS